MRIKDKYGSVLHIKQAKNGKIIIPFASIFITLSKEDAEKIGGLYDIEDFSREAYLKAYE